MTHRGVRMAIGAALTIGWVVALYLGTRGTDCSLNSCRVLVILIFAPLVLSPLALGFWLGPCLSWRAKLLASVCSAGVALWTMATLSLVEASGASATGLILSGSPRSDLQAGAVMLGVIFAPLGIAVGYLLVSLGAFARGRTRPSDGGSVGRRSPATRPEL